MDDTGEMRTMRDTVFFEGLLCGCAVSHSADFPAENSCRRSDFRHVAAHGAVME